MFTLTAEEDYLIAYREYVSHTVVPRLYNEWAAIISISSTLSHQCWVKRGYYNVFPNLYVMLIGDPGTGKGTTCAILQSVLQTSGFSRFAPDRTTKEKFLVDLEEGFESGSGGAVGFNSTAPDEFFNVPMFTQGPERPEGSTSDVLILAEELSDFFGSDNIDFVALLTKLWSYTGVYEQKIKTGRSVKIPNPCINFYAATTHDSFQITFPSRMLGTGFLARFILVYGALGDQAEIAFPESPVETGKTKLGNLLQEIQRTTVGQIEINSDSRVVFERVLRNYSGPDDVRFKHYQSRRFVQLLKIAICFCASRRGKEISTEDIISANTLLYATEQDMGKALGEFGKSKNAEVSNKIMQVLYKATRPIPTLTIWKLVSSDLAAMKELHEIMNNLQSSEKISWIKINEKGAGGWLPNLASPNTEAKMLAGGEGLLNREYLNYLMG